MSHRKYHAKPTAPKEAVYPKTLQGRHFGPSFPSGIKLDIDYSLLNLEISRSKTRFRATISSSAQSINAIALVE